MWEAALDERGKLEMRVGDEARRLIGMHPGLLSGLVCAGANVPAPCGPVNAATHAPRTDHALRDAAGLVESIPLIATTLER